MKTLELEPNPLEELFLKRISKNIEDMTSNDWALLVIDFFEFCKPYMQTFQGKWADMEQPESDSRYQEFRYVGQEHWGQGTLKHVTCKATAAYIDKQSPKLSPDATYELPEGIAFDTGVRRISRAGYIKERISDESLHYTAIIVIAENAQLLHCEMTYTDTDPWVVGWIVCDCSVSFVNAEKLEHMFENTKMDPQKLLRAIFEFTKEVIWAEQMRAMEEKTRAFTGMFSDAVTSTFM